MSQILVNIVFRWQLVAWWHQAITHSMLTFHQWVNGSVVLLIHLRAIGLIHKSQNAPVPYPTMFHSEQICAHFCSEWSIVGYGTGAFWDLWHVLFRVFWNDLVFIVVYVYIQMNKCNTVVSSIANTGVMDLCKTVVTPLLTRWSYHSLVLSHRSNSK